MGRAFLLTLMNSAVTNVWLCRCFSRLYVFSSLGHVSRVIDHTFDSLLAFEGLIVFQAVVLYIAVRACKVPRSLPPTTLVSGWLSQCRHPVEHEVVSWSGFAFSFPSQQMMQSRFSRACWSLVCLL